MAMRKPQAPNDPENMVCTTTVVFVSLIECIIGDYTFFEWTVNPSNCKIYRKNIEVRVVELLKALVLNGRIEKFREF